VVSKRKYEGEGQDRTIMRSVYSREKNV